MENLQKKRAITPLMGTFLLLTFAVAVGVVVMNLGSAQAESNAVCALEIGMSFVSIAGEEQICYSPAERVISFTIENGVNAKIEGLVVSVIGTEKAETFELEEAKMLRAGSYVGKVVFDQKVSGSIRQIKISPKLILKDELQICPDQALVIETVREC